jgi:hypothetical protein
MVLNFTLELSGSTLDWGAFQLQCLISWCISESTNEFQKNFLENNSLCVTINLTKLPECHNVVPTSEAVKTVTCCWQYVSYWECGVTSNYMILDA